MGGARRFVRTRRARQDLIEIWKYIAADNPTAADALLDRIDESCRRLAEHPQLKPSRHDIRPGLRYLIVGEYVILYRISMTASRSSASSTAGATCSVCSDERGVKSCRRYRRAGQRQRNPPWLIGSGKQRRVSARQHSAEIAPPRFRPTGSFISPLCQR